MPKLICLLLIIFSFPTVNGQNSSDSLVRQAFNNYKSAILNDKGIDAANAVDSRTINYYDKIAELTRSADSVEVSALPIIDKMTVLTLRHRAKNEEIKAMDGKATLIYAINNGMVGKNSVATLTIGDVMIDGTFAKGQIIANRQKAPIFFHFYQEQGTGKIDLTSLFPTTGAAFEKMIEYSGKDHNEFILQILESLTGRKPRKNIWQGMN